MVLRQAHHPPYTSAPKKKAGCAKGNNLQEKYGQHQKIRTQSTNALKKTRKKNDSYNRQIRHKPSQKYDPVNINTLNVNSGRVVNFFYSESTSNLKNSTKRRLTALFG